MTDVITYEVAPGVEVYWLPTNKFNSLRWEFNFITPQSGPKTTARRLLADLLQRSSEKYPDESQLALKLSNLYSTELTAKTTIFQNLNILSLGMIIPQVDSKDLNEEALSLLEQVILHPNLNAAHDQFNEEAFELEHMNLENAYISLADNYSLQASLSLKKLLYQNNPDLALPPFGKVEQLKSLNSGNLFAEYKKMITNNRVIITVVGDPERKIVPNYISKLDCFANDYELVQLQTDGVVDLPNTFVTEKQIEDIRQSQLVIAYKAISKIDKAVLQVLNLIFGGDDQSCLFQTVREQEGLAYSVYSNANGYQQFITVQAGVAEENIAQAEALIDEQLQSLPDAVTEEALQHAKLSLINRRLINSDNIIHQADRLLMKALNSNVVLADQDYIDKVEAVTLEQVQQAATYLRKTAAYYLVGSADSDE